MSPAATFSVGFLILVLLGWYFATDNERLKRIIGTLLTVVVCCLCVVSAYPPIDVLAKDAQGKQIIGEDGRPKLAQTGKIPLGIDLKGGTSWLVKVQPGNGKEPSKEMLDRAMETFRKRVDSGGVAEPVIVPSPPDRILVQLPGLDPKMVEDYRNKLQQVAKLEFRMVHPDNESLARAVANKTQILEPGYELKTYIHWKEKKDANGKTIKTKEAEEPILVKKQVDIPGSMVQKAFATYGQRGGRSYSGSTKQARNYLESLPRPT